MRPVAALACALALLLAACGGGSGAPRVRTGLERLAEGEVAGLEGKRLGLVMHGASRTADGRSALAVVQARGLRVVRLFSPEHGLLGEAAAGEAVGGGVDPASGLPWVSLYGERRKPLPEDLADLDVLVFDLQDAGVRFYTYASTLLLCLEAVAEAGIEMVVLDRPNPLGGERIEGPLSASREEVPASFLNLAPGPLVHGLTLGELARYANARLPQPARLTVVALTGWRRSMGWEETGLPWVPPSPNLRTAEAALAYPGVALLEATNVSEGRGTEAPFLLLGAPWLEPAAQGLGVEGLEVPGFALSATVFTPLASPAAPSPRYAPKYAGFPVQGWRVRVTDARRAEPYRLGVALLAALSRQPGFEWRQGGAALTTLVGTPRLLADLEAGKSVEAIVAQDWPDRTQWREERREALLY